tara:strand:+ start:429 stop:689 length:261 start_codon:yes stop_codon:yes gene_type:complete
MRIELTKEEVAGVITSIQKYVLKEWDEEIGNLKAELLLDYFIKEIGPYAYNKGVRDAESFFRSKLEDLQGSCHEYELTYWEERKKS